MRLAKFITVFAVIALASTSFAEDKKLTEREPVKCGDVETVVIDGAYISAKGKVPGVHVLDSCSVIIKNSYIEADAVAVHVFGTGTVTISDSTIYGKKSGIALLGTSTLVISNSVVGGKKKSLAAKATSTATAKATVFHGKKTVGRFATFKDGGNNKYHKRLKKRFKAPPH